MIAVSFGAIRKIKVFKTEVVLFYKIYTASRNLKLLKKSPNA